MFANRPLSRTASLLGPAVFVALGLALSGCGNGDSGVEAKDTTAVGENRAARTLAHRFLRYSYEGAILRSTHPLNDSVAALVNHPAPGRYLTLVDTFSIGTTGVESDSVSTVSVTFPHAIKVSSDWRTTEPEVGAQRTLRVGRERILEGPGIVGWRALKAHILDVVPDSGDAVAARIEERFRQLAETPST